MRIGVGRTGQFIPIAAMVMFTTVVFLVAVVNIFAVARAKLKVQNLADAAALNVASQVASALNKTADLNEWMNHMVDLGPNAHPSCQPAPGDPPNCGCFKPPLIPPISCAENPSGSNARFIFQSPDDAKAYARLVQTINQTQLKFIEFYNEVIGAGTRSTMNTSQFGSLSAILKADIPELAKPDIQVLVWNNRSAENNLDSEKRNAEVKLRNSTPGGNINAYGMQEIKLVAKDLQITYMKSMKGSGGSVRLDPTPSTLRLALTLNTRGPMSRDPVGYMVLAPQQSTLKVKRRGSDSDRIGVGVCVIKQVKMPFLNNQTVSAVAKAYVVEGSGKGLRDDPSEKDSATGMAVFKPTYWVKLAGN